MKKYVDKDKLQEYSAKLTTKYKSIFATKNEVGSPLVAETVSEMTDTEKVYVYVGSETGYTSGNWYYYDGSAWVSGGIYNAVAFETDDTLAISGKAADSKAVGDRFDNVENNVESVEADIEQLSEYTSSVIDITTINKTVSGQSVHFEDGANGALLKGLTIDIVPFQSGEGTPSISNIRPITGFETINITIDDGGQNSETVTIDFSDNAGIVYSGTLDVVKGILIVDKVKRTFTGETGTEAWFALSQYHAFYVLNNLQGTRNNADGLCNIAKKAPSLAQKGFIIGLSNKYIYFSQVYSDWGVDNVPDLRTWLSTNNIEVVFPLENPITYNLTPIQLKTFLGENNIINDCGNMTINYIVDNQSYIDSENAQNKEIIADVELNFTASKNHIAGSFLIIDSTLYKVTQNIIAGSTITPGTNCTETTVSSELVQIKEDIQTNNANLQNKKVNIPLDANNQPTNGIDGQVLRTNGDGTTQWTDQGLPTDEQTKNAVSEWLNDNPEATTTVADGSLTSNKFTDNLKLHTIKDYVTPEMYGAVGDGNTDDTLAVEEALNSGKNVVLLSVYKITQGITIYKPVNILSFNRGGIKGSTTDFLLNIERNPSNPADYRNYYLYNISITQSGTGNALQFTGWGDYLSQMKIENCRLFVSLTSAVGWAIYCDNSLAHSIVRGCNIQGNGIYGAVRDANIFEKNLFYGEGTGIRLEPARGCLNNAILNNTIVNWGGNGVQIYGAQQCLISNNQFEYGGTANQYSATKGMIYIDASLSGAAQHISIENNNFGGGTYLDYLIYIENAEETRISKNRLVAVNEAEIYIGNEAIRTIVRGDNWGVSQTSNPRTGKYEQYIVVDNGLGTIGTWRTLNAQGDNTKPFQYMKDEFGNVYLTEFNLSSLVISEIAQLPTYYRPMEAICAKALLSSDGTKEIIVNINTDGTISVVGAIPATGYYKTPIYFRAPKYS